ncbi:MAG: hypothetical protein JOY71_07090 [Acetobacteraceae bacterium]|nr:hypothetical protein [Acetobacteraceae bacterium]
MLHSVLKRRRPPRTPRRRQPWVGFDADWIIDELNERGAKSVISQRPNRVAPLAIHREIYRWRHLTENFFGRLKEFKANRHAER